MSENRSLEFLTQSISDEVIKALGLKPDGWYRRFLAPLIRLPAARFSRIALEFDHYVAEGGFANAACKILPRFIKGVDFHGLENIPRDGPLLVVSNHPGTVDGLCIAAGLGRNDIRIVASGVPFLRSLKASALHFIYSSLDTYKRMMVVRSAIRHLCEGGSVLIFPSGHLDPDPEVLQGADQALFEWSPSVELLLKKVPQVQVLIAIVSGVLSRHSLRSPLTRLRKSLRDRQRIAEIYQIARQMVLGLREDIIPRVSFGIPLRVPELAASSGEGSLLPALVRHAQKLLADHEASRARAWERRWNFVETL